MTVWQDEIAIQPVLILCRLREAETTSVEAQQDIFRRTGLYHDYQRINTYHMDVSLRTSVVGMLIKLFQPSGAITIAQSHR